MNIENIRRRQAGLFPDSDNGCIAERSRNADVLNSEEKRQGFLVHKGAQ
jgi:hypothetical protein